MHILFTRPLEDCHEMILKFQSLGHEISHLPLISIEGLKYEAPNYSEFKAIILSYAGINALGLNQNISQTFSIAEIIPCAGQGVIALQCRNNDEDLIELLKKVDHQSTHSAIKAERNVLKVLEGDCETAVGAFANIEENKINLEVELFSLDGSKRFHLKSSESIDKAEELGIEMGKTLKKMSNNTYKK